jgi:hypothetical protein
MTQCRFCKSDIPDDATRCPHCTSFLDGEQPQGSPGQVTYIVDKGLVAFGKFAGSILAIFLTVGIFLYGVYVKQLRKEIEDTHVGSQKLDLDIKQAKMDLDRETTDIKKDVESAEGSAREARETSSQMHNFLQEAEKSKQHIQEYEITLLASPAGSKQARSPGPSQTAPNPVQLEHLVEVKLLETLKDVLAPKQYSALQTQIGAEKGRPAATSV